jgi:steroid delta-isomerase-like uncharacterized protein
MNITRVMLPALLLVLASPIPASAVSTQARSCSAAHRAQVEAFVDLYFDVYNSHDMSRLGEILTPDSINHNPLGIMDVAQLAATMEQFYVAFPDLEYQIEDIAIDGDRLIVEYTYTGTHLGPLLGVPATGTAVHGRGLEISTLDNGRIAETRNYSDVFGLFGQLGLI